MIWVSFPPSLRSSSCSSFPEIPAVLPPSNATELPSHPPLGQLFREEHYHSELGSPGGARLLVTITVVEAVMVKSCGRLRGEKKVRAGRGGSSRYLRRRRGVESFCGLRPRD